MPSGPTVTDWGVSDELIPAPARPIRPTTVSYWLSEGFMSMTSSAPLAVSVTSRVVPCGLTAIADGEGALGSEPCGIEIVAITGFVDVPTSAVAMTETEGVVPFAT